MIVKNETFKVSQHDFKGEIGKNLILPMIIWAGLIIVFLNVKHIPIDFNAKGDVVLRQFAKVIMTIVLPITLIHLLYKNKSDFGIYFPPHRDSLRLSFKAFTVLGPACMTFMLIAFVGWGFGDWPGGITLSIAFFTASYFVPRATTGLVTRAALQSPNNTINLVILLSMLALLVTHLTLDQTPIISNIFYYVLIVGFGEEVFFRGYIQSSLNRYFGKSFRIGDVKFGWGLVLAAALFGLSHALVTVPPTWPWAVWTFVMGLALGFIREKDGSILAPAVLHAMLDFPLVFMSG